MCISGTSGHGSLTWINETGNFITMVKNEVATKSSSFKITANKDCIVEIYKNPGESTGTHTTLNMTAGDSVSIDAKIYNVATSSGRDQYGIAVIDAHE